MPTYSKCATCGEVKTVEEFHRLRIYNGRRVYASECKACVNVGGAPTGVREAAEKRGLPTSIHTCPCCSETKTGEEFGYRIVDGNAYVMPRCRTCRKTVLDARREDPRKRLVDGAKTRAKKKGIPFSITYDTLVVPELCPVFKIPLQCGRGKRTDHSPTLDRINPSLGYTEDNVRVISWKANRLKSNMTADELEALYLYAKNCH